MNKAYRVIFNHATQTWTAVAEFAKAKGKTKSLKLSAVATAIAAATTAGTAHAAVADSQIKTDVDTNSILISPNNNQGATQVNGFVDQHPGLPTVYGRPDTTNRNIGRDGIRVGTAMTLRDGQILIGNNLQNIGYAGDVVVGNRARVGGGGNDSFSTLVGYGTVGAGPSVSLGLGAQADMASIKGSLNGNVASVAVGAYSYTGGNIDGSTAVGAEAFAQRTGSTAIGQQAGVAFDRHNPFKGDADALGINMPERITFGEGAGSQGGVNGVSVGIQSAARSNNSIAIGNSTMTGAHLPASNAAASVAIGNNAAALRQSTIAIGDNAIAGGYQTTNIAALTDRVNTAQAAVATAEAAFASAQAVANANASHFNQFLEGRAKADVDTAKLVLARAQEELALANAYATTTTATNAIAIGKNTQALEQNSAAVGAENRVTSQKTYVLGGGVGKNDTNGNLDGTTVENSVYLGYDSEATALKGAAVNKDRTAGATTTAGATAAVDSATVNGVTYNGFAGATPVGVVTVGASGAERRIQNVAAGEISATSTDAINGSQLYHVMKPLTFKANTNLDTEVAGAGIAAADGTQRSMGETLNIIGAKDAIALARNEDAAVAGAYSAKNIQTVVTKNDELQIQIAENPQFKSVDLGDDIVPDSSTATSGTVPTANLDKAVSLGDVLNTGWNLEVGSKAADFVRPYDTVNFIGEGVTITEENDSTNSKTNIKFKVEQPTAGTFKADENGSLAPTDGEGDKLASVKGVADAVNNSYWNINTSQDGAAEAKVGDGKVNPSNNVVFNGKGAVKVAAGTTDAGKYTVDFSVDTDNTTIEVKNGKLAAKTSTLAAAPIDNPAAPTAGTILPGDAPTALTTAKNVADMINAAAWKATSAATAAGTNEGTTTELVKAGDTVTFEADSGVKIVQAGEKFTFSVKTDGKTTRINDKGEVEAIAPATAAIAPNEDGSVTGPVNNPALQEALTAAQDELAALPTDATEEAKKAAQDKVAAAQNAINNAPNALATAQNVADAINASGFILTTGQQESGKTATPEVSELISPSNVVTMVAGDNLVVAQEAGKVVYSLNPDININSAKVGGVPNPADTANPTKAPITIGTVNENGTPKNVISGLDSTLPVTVNGAAPTTAQAAPTLSPEALTKAATVEDVLNAGWNLQNNGAAKDFVKAYDTVNFVDGAGTKAVVDVKADGTIADVKYDVQVDGTTVKFDKDGKLTAVQPATSVDGTKVGGDTNFGDTNTINATTNEAGDIVFEAKTAEIAPNEDGSVAGPVNNPALQEALTAAQDELAALPTDATEEAKKAAQDKVAAAQNAINNAPNALATAQNVADAINASGFILTTGQQESGKTATPEVSELISPSNVVTMVAGDNLVVAQEAGKVVYSLNPDIAINSATVGSPDAPIVIGVTEAGDNVITGLTNTLAPLNTNPAETKAPTFDDVKLGSAATLSDVLNAGWNLQNNGAAKDFVKPYDTVNFVDGKGTKAVVDVKADGTIADVKFDVDVTQLSAPITNNANGSVTGPANSTELADALKAAEEALAALPADATPEQKAAAEKAVQDAKDAVNNAGNALATAQNVADAINASGWNATSGKVGTGVVSGTTNELINPSEVVTFQAGDNMVLEQAGNVFTYSVSKDPVFNNVTANQVTVGGTPATQDAPAKAPIVIGTNPEGKNEITGLDTTLPVPADSATKPADINESKAATLGDVLNAGWNLKNNGEAKDVVTPYDTVDFVDGNGTKVVVESKDGVSTVKVDIDPTQIAAPVTNVVEGDQAGSVTGPTTAAEEALKAAQDELAALPADASEEAKQAAADKVAAAQNAVNNAGNQLATAQNVANAINNSGWKATSGTVGTGTRDGADATVELINPAETVTFNAGDNLVIEQAGNEFTYSLNKDIAINSAKIGNADAPITIGTDAAGNNVIDGLTTTIAAPTTEVKPADKPTADKLDNAATLGDVLNAGWNLQENGTAKDVVTPYDTVNFANGAGTTVNITSDGATSVVKVDVAVDDTTVKIVDGKLTAVQPDTLVNGNKVGGNINLVDSDTVSVVPGDNPGDIKFNVNTAAITPVTEGDKAGSVTGPVTPALADALKAAQDELAALPADASEEAKQAAADKVAAAQNAVNKAGNAVATAQNVADAINASGWNATSGKVGTGVVSGTTKELINPSETVTFNAGDNLVLEQNGNEFTYSLNKDINVNSVTANQAIFGGSPATEDAPAKAPIIIGTTPAGKNVVSGLDTTIAAPTTANNPADKPTAAQQENAATLGDVLNAGWNLQENGTAKDVVTPYDTVNFANGNATTVNITTDGTTSVVKVDVATDNTTVEIKDGKIAAKTSPITNAADGSVNAPANPAALATAGDVANAINNSGFDVKASVADAGSELAVGGKAGVAKDTGNGRVNPGSTVNVKAGRNIEIERNGKDVTIATSADPIFNSVETTNLKVAAGGNVDMGGNRIQNVAPGVAPTDAVNVSQLGTAIGNAIAPIQNRIDDLDDNYRAGLAGSAALVNIPQVTRPGANLVGVGVGHFKGQSAIAVGFSSASDNERLIFKISGSANTQGDYSIGSGMGWQW